MAHVWVALEQDEDGYPPYTEEQLHTTEVGPELHRVESVPAFLPEVAVGDVLTTQTMADGEVWATGVEEAGDRWCARIIGLDGYDDERIVEIFASMGATATLTPYGILTLDVGPEVDADHVLQGLEVGRRDGDWDYDVGVRPGG